MRLIALEFGGLHGAGAVLMIAGAAAGALLTLGALLRAVWRGVRALWRGSRRLLLLVEVVEERSRELIHNGGGSIKDRSDQAADRMAIVEAGLREVRGMVAAVASRLDTHLQSGEEYSGVGDPQ